MILLSETRMGDHARFISVNHPRSVQSFSIRLWGFRIPFLGIPVVFRWDLVLYLFHNLEVFLLNLIFLFGRGNSVIRLHYFVGNPGFRSWIDVPIRWRRIFPLSLGLFVSSEVGIWFGWTS